jgi:crotonobetainyl-CoA:carnitine CoA-transferase CaiB-like acyl-CoA transferase
LTATYRTKDDRFLSLAIVNPDSYWAELCGVLGHPELIDEPRFANANVRQQNVEACVALFDQIFAAHDLAYWRGAFQNFSGAWAPYQRPSELHDDPWARESGFFTELDLDGTRKLEVVSSPVNFDEYDGPKRMPGAPEVGQHTEEILLEMGQSWEDIAAWKEKGVIT